MRKWIFIIFFSMNAVSLAGQDLSQPVTVSKDSVRYTRFKERMYKRKFTKKVYQAFFRDIYNRNKSSAEEVKIETNPFEAYKGFYIRKITISQLNTIGASVYDTTRTGNKFERFLSNNLHVNTSEKKMRRSMLLFEEGDRINPEQIKDNERILRQSNVILDARILPIPIENDSKTIDVLVIIQDVWPVVPQGSFSGFDDFSVGLINHNVLGSTHTSSSLVRWRSEDTLQRFWARSTYTIPYYKRTFISRDFGVIWERDLKHVFAKAHRPFISVETRYAGAVEVGIREVREYRKSVFNLDSTLMFPVRYMYNDAWIGRAFKLGSSTANQNKRLVVAARHYSFGHIVRPEVTADSNRNYWNQSGLLLSIGFSNRNYKRDVLIYGFGRTEDVPVGSMASITTGQSITEFGRMGYLGSRFSMGRYLPEKQGYLYGLLDMGTFIKDKKAHQAVISTSVNYFTPLMTVGLAQVRQFVNIGYTQGFRRDELEFINLTEERRIRGVWSDRLIGKKRLNLGMETVVFSPNSVIGFRGAYFAFADMGLIANTGSIWKSPLYQAYGIGIRLRNEHLTFNTIELRLAYYPNIPALSSPFRFGVSGATVFRFQDFDISAPEIVPLR